MVRLKKKKQIKEKTGLWAMINEKETKKKIKPHHLKVHLKIRKKKKRLEKIIKNFLNFIKKIKFHNRKKHAFPSKKYIGKKESFLPIKESVREVPFVNPNSRIENAVEILVNENRHRIPIIENKEIVGVIGAKEILELLSRSFPLDISAFEKNKEKIREIMKKPVKEIMSKDFVVVQADKPIEYGLKLLNMPDVNEIYVVDKKKFLGVIDEEAIMKIFEKSQSNKSMDIEAIKTTIDKVLEFVPPDKGISTQEIAKKLNTAKEKVDEWVKILAEQGLVELEFPSLNKIIVKRKK